MSIKVFGILELNDELGIREKVDISFLVVEKAIKNRFGVNLGGNIFSGFMKKYERSQKRIPFELTDDPMDINADCLFTRDYIIEASDDLGERLESRMLRVQNFLNELLKTKYINRIILEISTDDEDNFETVEVKVNDFCSKMLELYKLVGCWPPIVRIIVK